jgi:hypothetical protein
MENLKCTYCDRNLIKEIFSSTFTCLKCGVSDHCFISPNMYEFSAIHNNILYRLSISTDVSSTFLRKYIYNTPDVRHSIGLIYVPKCFPIDFNNNLKPQVTDIIVKLKRLIAFQ